jgi:hypothetical protein
MHEVSLIPSDTLISVYDSTRVTMLGVSVTGLPEWVVWTAAVMAVIGVIAVVTAVIR